MKALVRVFALPLLFCAYHIHAQEIPRVDVPAPYCDGTFFAERCGNIDFFFHDYERDRWTPGDGGGAGAQRAPLKAKPPSINNSNKERCPDSTKTTGHPVFIPTGEKYKDELDFTSQGKYGFSLTRTYRSMNATGILFGPNWTSNLDPSRLTASDEVLIDIVPPGWSRIPKSFVLTEADGGKYNYKFKRVWPEVGGDGDSSSLPEYFVYTVNDSAASGELHFYPDGRETIVTKNRTTYIYNRDLLLQGVSDPSSGLGLTYTYAADSAHRLEWITNVVGQTVRFIWAGNRVTQVQDPAGNSWVYGYNCVFRRNWTLVPPQTGHSFQRKLDTCSRPNWTLGA